MSRKLRGITLLLSLFIYPLCATPQSHTMHRLEISDLLPEGISRDVHVDSKGILWFSIGRKIHRFDGYRLNEVPIHGSSGGVLRNIGNGKFTEDANGKLWLIDSENGLFKYEDKARRFVLQDFRQGAAKSLQGSYLHLIGPSGGIWIVIAGGDLAVVDSMTGELLHKVQTSRYFNADSDYIAGLASSDDDHIWVATNRGFLLKCSQGSHNCEVIDLQGLNEVGRDLRVNQLQKWGRNRLVIATQTHGVLYFETQPSGNSKTKQTYTPNNLKPLVSTKAWSLFVDGSENVWISSHSGLVVIEPDGSPLSVTGGNEKSSQLLFTEFSDFDKEGILAQSPTGIYILRKKKFQVFGEASGLPSPIITGFEQLDDKRVVVASLGGLSVFNASNDGQIIRSLSLKEDRLAHTEVMALESGTNGELWFGGFSGGLRVLENSLSRSRKISKSEKLDAVSVIRRFDDSRILVGTPYHGLYMVDDNGAEQIHISENSYPHTLAHNAVYSVLKIGGQLILVGGEGGIAEVTLQESSAVTKIAQVRHHLDRETILTIHESADGQLWAGSAQGGLYRASKPTGHTPISFEIAPTSPALPDNTIYAIEEDSSGYLWLSTNKGLVRLNSSTLSITTYNRTEGLPHDEFNLAASFSDQDQHLYFGGNQGFVRFDPRTFVEHRIHSSLYVTEIMIHREPVSYDPVYVETPEIVLDHNDHSLDVEFSTMDIISPGRSRYKYKLENFDNDWVDIGTRNSATFTSLPAGNYVLRVIGADSKGVWNYDGITLPVRVLPAPWLTWWAFASYALLFLGFLVLVKRSYDTYLQKVAATQEAEQMKITATLVMDDLQDQLEVENRLVDNLRKHTTSTFEMVDEFLTMELEELYGEEIDVPLGRVRERLNCLKALEAAVYFLGDQLKVNFRDAVDRCFAEVLKAHPHPTAELVLANDCCEELVAIDIAAPLLLMTHELILNSVTHAYPDSVGVECIEIKFKPEGGNYRFEYEDAGCGLPNSIDPARPTTVGMDLIARIITRLGATLEVERERGATFRAKIPGQEA